MVNILDKQTKLLTLNQKNNYKLIEDVNNILNNYSSDAILISGNKFIGKFDLIKNIIETYFINSNASIENNLYILGNGILSILIEETRDALHFLSLKPIQSKKKVLIINGIDLMNNNSLNGVLKAIEDISEDTTIIAINSMKNALPLTIYSRFKKFKFNLISFEEFQTFYANKQINLEELLFYYHFTNASILLTDLYLTLNLFFFYKKINSLQKEQKFQFIQYYIHELSTKIKQLNAGEIDFKQLAFQLYDYSANEAKISANEDYFLLKKEILNFWL